MKHYTMITLAAKVAEQANKLIIARLKVHGLQDIAPSHGDILSLLLDGSSREMSEIARLIHRTKPTVTVLVEKLEKSGYVQRTKCDIDSRCTRISLTPKGLMLKPIFEEISLELNSVAYRDMSDIEAETIEALLEKALKNFKQ